MLALPPFLPCLERMMCRVWSIQRSGFLSEDTVAKVKVLGKGDAGLAQLEKYIPKVLLTYTTLCVTCSNLSETPLNNMKFQ